MKNGARFAFGGFVACASIVAAVSARVPQASAQSAPPSQAATPTDTQASSTPTPPVGPTSSAPVAPVPPAAPVAPATPVYAFVYRASPQPIPPPDVPVIAEIDLNATTLTPPAPLHVRVLTSVAVVSVTAQTSLAFITRSIPIPKAQAGLFLFDGYIPEVPAFLRNHTFNVDFIATAANGTRTDVSLPLRLN